MQSLGRALFFAWFTGTRVTRCGTRVTALCLSSKEDREADLDRRRIREGSVGAPWSTGSFHDHVDDDPHMIRAKDDYRRWPNGSSGFSRGHERV